MAKRIFRNVVLAVILSVLLTAAIIVPSLYTVHEKSMSRELHQEADCIVLALEIADDDLAYLESLNTDSRITLLDSDGDVLYDSVADAAQMENHAARPEVIQALSSGSGESTRTSDTLSELRCCRKR